MTSQATLVQDKLDVVEKSRANLLNWRGQFTPQFVAYILDSFSEPGDTVIDPFSGSGTVIQECSVKRMSAYGYEINPAAYAMSKFFTFANLPVTERQALLASLESKLLEFLAIFPNLPLLQDKHEFRERYSNLSDFAKDFFSHIANQQERILAVNTLLVAESRNRADIHSTILSAFQYLRKALLTLPYSEQVVSAHLGDARLIHEHCPVKADILLTSPPYINVFNYHQNHRAILETLGWNILRVAHSEIGSNRKHRGNRFRTVVQYCLDMEQALISFWHSLRADGVIVLVVGRESNVRKTPFYNGEIIKDIMTGIGGFREPINYERKFINRFGLRIKEDIIVSRKTPFAPTSHPAQQIARKHLEFALQSCPSDVQKDIGDAMNSIDEIAPSPLFDMKNVFSHA